LEVSEVPATLVAGCQQVVVFSSTGGKPPEEELSFGELEGLAFCSLDCERLIVHRHRQDLPVAEQLTL